MEAIKAVPIASEEEKKNGWLFDTGYTREIINVMEDPVDMESVDEILDILHKRGHIVKESRAYDK